MLKIRKNFYSIVENFKIFLGENLGEWKHKIISVKV